jgi:hypothetical protein
MAHIEATVQIACRFRFALGAGSVRSKTLIGIRCSQMLKEVAKNQAQSASPRIDTAGSKFESSSKLIRENACNKTDG